MTVPQYRLRLSVHLRRIRTIVGFVPIEVPKSTGTVITVPYTGAVKSVCSREKWAQCSLLTFCTVEASVRGGKNSVFFSRKILTFSGKRV